MKINNYVVGFAFSENLKSILLVKKLRPKWQAGYLNGIGGKIEAGETPLEAMKREASEEAGIDVEWIKKGFLTGDNFDVHVFYAYTDDIFNYKQKEDEPLGVYGVDNIIEPVVNNVNYLISFGLYSEPNEFITLRYYL